MSGAEHAQAEASFKAAAKAYRAEGATKAASQMASLASSHATIGAFRREQEAKTSAAAKEKDKATGGGSDDINRDDQGRFAPK